MPTLFHAVRRSLAVAAVTLLVVGAAVAATPASARHELQSFLVLGHQPRRPRRSGRRPDQPVPRRQGSVPARRLDPAYGILGVEVAPHGGQRVLRSQRPGPTRLAHCVPARDRLWLQRRRVGGEHRVGLRDCTVRRERLARLLRPQGEHRERELHLDRSRRRRQRRRPALLDAELRHRRLRQHTAAACSAARAAGCRTCNARADSPGTNSRRTDDARAGSPGYRTNGVTSRCGGSVRGGAARHRWRPRSRLEQSPPTSPGRRADHGSSRRFRSSRWRPAGRSRPAR